MNKLDKIKQIFEAYSLVADEDIFKLTLGGKTTPIITKTGIQKIASKEKYKYTFEVIVCTPDYCAVRCTVSDSNGEELAQSFGSAEAKNVRNPTKYYLEMAEKRAKVRAVLIALDVHGYIYSEEEADDFKQV
jgi:hypothetical protein